MSSTPLPVSEVFAFSPPVVKGGHVVLPVLVGGSPPHTHGLRSSVELWRKAALAVLSATGPARCGRGRPPRQAAAGFAVLIVIAITAVVGALGALGLKHYAESRAPAKLARKEQAVSDAQVPVLRGVQENVHKTQLAISQIPDSRAKQVATAFAANAAAGIDQVVGAPPQADLVVWQSLVDRLLSENAAIRAKADSDNAAAEGRLVTVSTKLAAVAADRDEYQRKFNAQAAEAIAQQATIRKYEWIAGAVLALWLLGQILAKAAQANPIFEGASALVNTVVAPGVKAALSDAKQTIQGVGKAIGVVQSTMTPAAASSLATNIAAAVPNQNHVSAIAGAAAAISGSTTSIPKTT